MGNEGLTRKTAQTERTGAGLAICKGQTREKGRTATCPNVRNLPEFLKLELHGNVEAGKMSVVSVVGPRKQQTNVPAATTRTDHVANTVRLTKPKPSLEIANHTTEDQKRP